MKIRSLSQYHETVTATHCKSQSLSSGPHLQGRRRRGILATRCASSPPAGANQAAQLLIFLLLLLLHSLASPGSC